MVSAVAARQASSHPILVDDIVQKVFVDLASEAFRMKAEVKIAGWLHRHTCFVASNLMRSERRRIARERKAAEMQELRGDDADWSVLEPKLDASINELPELDREAILLRFFRKLSLRQVGQSLGVSDDAAQKRIRRALEKMRKGLAAQGISISSLALSTALTNVSLLATPLNLCAGIATNALATASIAGGSSIVTATLTSTIMTKMTLITSIAAASIGIGGTYLVSQKRLNARDNQITILQTQLEEADARVASNLKRLDEQRDVEERNQQDRQELMRLRAEVKRRRQEAPSVSPRIEGPGREVEPLAAAFENNELAENFETEPSAYSPRESWQFEGFAEPEAAFKTAVWAMNEGDLENISLAWTDDYLASRAAEFTGKPDEEVVAELRRDIEMAEGLEVRGVEFISSRETIVDLEIRGDNVPPQIQARMKLVGSDWRFDGWVQ